MSDDETTKRSFARRALLREGFLLAALASVIGVTAAESAVADEKLSQKDAEYQPTPKNGQSCANCQHFIPPSSCKLVKGKISPNGWCDFWGAKT
jgi:hypothetical protein